MGMDRKKLKVEPGYIEQLALGLNLEEVDRSTSGFVSPDEARMRSETARQALKLAGVENPPDWFEQYGALLDGGWPWRIACYIAWAASPKMNRWPKTQNELAVQVLGLSSDRQIATWRKRNPTIDSLIADLQAAPMMEFRADAFRALALAASDPDHRNNPDRKLLFQMTGDFVPHAKIDVGRPEDVDDLSQYDEGELKRMAAAIEQQLSEGADGGQDAE